MAGLSRRSPEKTPVWSYATMESSRPGQIIRRPHFMTGLFVEIVLALAALSPAATRSAFLQQLDRPRVALDPRSEPREGAEHVTIATERKRDGSLERVPMLLVRPAASGRRPAVIVLHGTGGRKE